jgi:hypothetical protein
MVIARIAFRKALAAKAAAAITAAHSGARS